MPKRGKKSWEKVRKIKLKEGVRWRLRVEKAK